MQDTFDYKDFCPDEAIDGFLFCVFRQMNLADACRNVLCDLIEGSYIGDGTRSNKQFLNTNLGKFRVAVSERADNSSELWVLDQMGVGTILASHRTTAMEFLKLHGVRISWGKYMEKIWAELDALEEAVRLRASA